MFHENNIVFLLLCVLQHAHHQNPVSIHHYTVDPNFTLLSLPSENHYLVSGHMYLFFFDLVFALGCLVVWLAFFIIHMSKIIWYYSFSV